MPGTSRKRKVRHIAAPKGGVLFSQSFKLGESSAPPEVPVLREEPPGRLEIRIAPHRMINPSTSASIINADPIPDHVTMFDVADWYNYAEDRDNINGELDDTVEDDLEAFEEGTAPLASPCSIHVIPGLEHLELMVPPRIVSRHSHPVAIPSPTSGIKPLKTIRQASQTLSGQEVALTNRYECNT